MVRVFINPDGSLEPEVYVVVARKTGVEYSTQCAGIDTEERGLEGYLVPVGGPQLSATLLEWFGAAFPTRSYVGVVWRDSQLSSLSELVAGIRFWYVDESGEDRVAPLRLDDTKRDTLTEAWVPVVTPVGPGVLIFANSD